MPRYIDASDWLAHEAQLRPRPYGELGVVMLSEPVYLLAFDPGGTTGWFRACYTPDGRILMGEVEYGHLEGPEHHTAIERLIKESDDVAAGHLQVVYENYVPEFARAQNYVALEYIGVIKVTCRRQLISAEGQGRGLKDFWTGSRIQKLAVWPVGKRHAQDAARHWLAYATKQSRVLHKNVMQTIR